LGASQYSIHEKRLNVTEESISKPKKFSVLEEIGGFSTFSPQGILLIHNIIAL